MHLMALIEFHYQVTHSIPLSKTQSPSFQTQGSKVHAQCISVKLLLVMKQSQISLQALALLSGKVLVTRN